MPLPEEFRINDSGIKQLSEAAYYVLTPKEIGGARSHVFDVDRPIYLPYLDSSSLSFSHNWNEADQGIKQLAESVLPGIQQKIASLASGISTVAGVLGAGGHISATSVYADSGPITLNVRSKLFSVYADGKMLSFLDKLRGEGFGTFGVGGRANLGGAVGQAGILKHPDWWDVKIVIFSGGGKTILFHATDMIIASTNFTFYSPFVSNNGKSEPMLVDVEIGFKSALRGFREHSAIGRSL